MSKGDWNNSLSKSVWGSAKTALAGSVAAIIFGGGIILASVITVTTPIKVETAEAMISVTPIPLPAVQYYLPYPGVLPDSPLYRLKAVRDFVNLRLTVGEVSKAEKELLFADKRIGAAKALLEGGKTQLAGVTAIKAEKYLISAGDRMIKASSGGEDVKSMLNTIYKSSFKHKEIMSMVVGATNGDERLVLEENLKQVEALQGRLEQAIRDAK